MEEIASHKREGQVLFQQVYLDTNDTRTQDIFDRAKALGTKAFAFTVDSAADGNRQRGARYGVPSACVKPFVLPPSLSLVKTCLYTGN